MTRIIACILAFASWFPYGASFSLPSTNGRSTTRIHRFSSVSEIPLPITPPEENNDHNLVIPVARYQSDPKDQRYSASDWYHNIKNLPNSSILREIKSPILAITIWSTLVSGAHHLLLKRGLTSIARGMCISYKPHSLLVSALGLLLVFRTNSAYQRFAEGRLIWEKVLSTARNLSRMAALYEKDLGTARKHRVLRLLAAFPYLLRQHIQPHSLDNEALIGTPHAILLLDPVINGRQGIHQPKGHWVDRRALPWCLFPSKALRTCTESYNRPLWVCDRLSHELANVEYSPNFTSRERLTFIGHVDKLSAAVGECERIHQTAVPLNYARHSLRSLTIWLFTLPFAMVADMGLLTGPVMGVISWVLIGVYQIGFTIEDPFQGSLRLSILCDAIYRDVMYDGIALQNQRETAFNAVNEEMSEWRAIEGAEQRAASSEVLLP